MTGAALMAYLQRRHRAVLADAIPDPSDQASLCQDCVRDAYIAIGLLTTTEGDPLTLEPETLGQDGDARAIARYALLRAACDEFAVKVDVKADMPQVQKRQSQMYLAAKEMLADAEAEIARRGYGKSAWTVGRLQLDILEPIEGYGYGYGYGGALLSPYGDLS